MWFSPWRRILRGRSGDAKPSGLRAGTKFVEEDTGVEYTYDPVMKDWKKKVAPYSALVAKDGSTVWAEDASGKTIASGEAGVDDASVIQSAATEIGEGKIYIAKGTYKITQKVILPAGISMESEGAIFDLSELNDVAFQYNSQEQAFNKVARIGGFFVQGNPSNAKTAFLHVYRFANQLIIENLRVFEVAKPIKIEGECFNTKINNIVMSEYDIGIEIIQGDGTKGPNGVIITNSNVEGGNIAIKIASGYTVKVDKCNFERNDISAIVVESDASEAKIINNYILSSAFTTGTTYGIHIKTARVDILNNTVIIDEDNIGVYFESPDGTGEYNIKK